MDQTFTEILELAPEALPAGLAGRLITIQGISQQIGLCCMDDAAYSRLREQLPRILHQLKGGTLYSDCGAPDSDASKLLAWSRDSLRKDPFIWLYPYRLCPFEVDKPPYENARFFEYLVSFEKDVLSMTPNMEKADLPD